jgi:hypothetical protein
VKGSILIELLLLCFFIVPGIIYSIWRLNTRQKICPKCKNPSMIPSDSPVGAKLLQAHMDAKPAVPSNNETLPVTKSLMASTVDLKKVLKIGGIIFLVLIGIPLWYIAIPALVGWFLWKKTKLNPKAKIAIAAVTAAIFLSAGWAVAHANRAPSLTIIEPKDSTSVQAQSITIKGKVDPASSIVTVNGRTIMRDGEGSFQADVALPNENNAIQVEATNGGHVSAATVNVARIFTEAEKAEQARLKAEADAKQQAATEAAHKAKEEADAKAKADQATFDASKAGKLCKQHADWSHEVCQNVVDHKYWIGMTYEMLIASYGSKPDHVNPSNYGNGTEYQWCWSDMTPSCFYGGEDGIIRSYN